MTSDHILAAISKNFAQLLLALGCYFSIVVLSAEVCFKYLKLFFLVVYLSQ